MGAIRVHRSRFFGSWRPHGGRRRRRHEKLRRCQAGWASAGLEKFRQERSSCCSQQQCLSSIASLILVTRRVLYMPALLFARCARLHPAALPVATTVLLWASAFPGIRAALKGFSPTGLASLRFTIAAIVLLMASLAIRPRWPRGRDLFQIALAGGVGITGYNILLNTGELTISAGAA